MSTEKLYTKLNFHNKKLSSLMVILTPFLTAGFTGMPTGMLSPETVTQTTRVRCDAAAPASKGIENIAQP